MKHTPTRSLSLLCALLLGPALAATPNYTKAQATAGAAMYKAQCALCHGTKLNNGGGAKLAGPAFLQKWTSNTLDDFYFIQSTTMPQTKPGSLSEKQYLSVLAYILQVNGFKPGAKPLLKADLKNYTFKK